MRTEWTIINPFSNPLIQSGDELADINGVEEFALRLAEEVYRSLTENKQCATVKVFSRKKFEEHYRNLMNGEVK